MVWGEGIGNFGIIFSLEDFLTKTLKLGRYTISFCHTEIEVKENEETRNVLFQEGCVVSGRHEAGWGRG